MKESITASELKSALAGGTPPLVIDVRRNSAYQSATETIAGALRRDPEQLAAWAPELPKASKVVVYCVHGHEVSQNAAKALNERGIAAQYLEGGLEEGWKSSGGALDRKPAGA